MNMNMCLIYITYTPRETYRSLLMGVHRCGPTVDRVRDAPRRRAAGHRASVQRPGLSARQRAPHEPQNLFAVAHRLPLHRWKGLRTPAARHREQLVRSWFFWCDGFLLFVLFVLVVLVGHWRRLSCVMSTSSSEDAFPCFAVARRRTNTLCTRSVHSRLSSLSLLLSSLLLSSLVFIFIFIFIFMSISRGWEASGCVPCPRPSLVAGVTEHFSGPTPPGLVLFRALLSSLFRSISSFVQKKSSRKSRSFFF